MMISHVGLHSDYGHFWRRQILRDQPADTLQTFQKSERILIDIIQQQGSTWHSQTEDVITESAVAFDAMLNLLNRLY